MSGYFLRGAEQRLAFEESFSSTLFGEDFDKETES